MTNATQLQQMKNAGYDVMLTYKVPHKSLGIVNCQFPTFKTLVNQSISKLKSNVKAFDFVIIEL